MHRRINIQFIVVALLLLKITVGCSTKRNTASVRAYHELTTRYNIYFNAKVAYEESLRGLYENQQDDYSRLLPMYPNSSISGDTIVKQLGGAFDQTIEKTTLAIQEHSISARPLRDPSRMQNEEYRRWLQQDEFNPYIDQAWLLMGKAHVLNGDYAQAVAVFNRAIRLFSHDRAVVSEAQVWLLRAYTEMEWFTDAEIIASTLSARGLKGKFRSLFNEFYAFYLYRKELYWEAIPFLEQTIKAQRNSVQKQRLQFLLGQTYVLLGDSNKAYAAFNKLKGLTIPHSIEVHAVLAQAEIAGDAEQALKQLSKMVKRPKNKSYADQIYFSIGNIHLHQQNDVESALYAYKQAEEQSDSGGVFKQLAQLVQGDIYYERKQFDKAAPKYQNAASQLIPQHPYYEKAVHRANVLQQLLPHLLSVKEQDSLRYLASMPYGEQVKIINDKINRLKAENKKADKVQQREQLRANQTLSTSVAEEPIDMLLLGGASVFYFYNEQLVMRGKQQFHNTWGRRKLEDNWRLSDKSSLSRLEDATWGVESEKRTPEFGKKESDELDIYSVDYYLHNIPATEEGFIISDSIIGEALYAIGEIAVTKLYEFDLGVESFSRYLQDYPDGKYCLPIYYQLYLVALRDRNEQQARYYKGLITKEFSETDLAEKMTDSEYDYIMQNYAEVEQNLYVDALHGHKVGDTLTVRKSFKKAIRFFEDSHYLPPLKLMNALTYAQELDPVKMKTELEELVNDYSSTPQSDLAQNILDGMAQGKTLTSTSLLGAFDWNTMPTDEQKDSVWFNSEVEQSAGWLLFKRGGEKKNALLFAVSDFNFTHFQKRFFPVSFTDISSYTALQIDGFETQDEAAAYNEMLQNDPQLSTTVTDSLYAIVLSHSNRQMILEGQKTIEEYLYYYDQTAKKEIGIIKPHSKLETELSGDPISEKVDRGAEILPPQIPVMILERGIQIEPEMTIEECLKALEKKEAEALSEAEEVMSERDKRRALKEREKERNKLLKERRRLLKQKEKERKAELKRREQERKKKLKEQNRMRKEKLKARQRVLKKQNR